MAVEPFILTGFFPEVCSISHFNLDFLSSASGKNYIVIPLKAVYSLF